MTKTDIFLIIRLVPIVFLIINYVVYRWFKAWITNFEGLKKHQKKIKIIYLGLLLIFSVPWLAITFQGTRSMSPPSQGLLAFYILPAYIWQLTNIATFIVLAIYKIILLILTPIAAIASKFKKSKEVDASKRVWLKKSAIAVPVAFCSINTIGVFSSEYDYVVNKIPISIKNWPENLKGLTITQISDLHFGPFMSEKKFMSYVPLINSLKSDLIVVTGDIIHSSANLIPMAIESLSRLRAIGGIYGCIGNHEYVAGSFAFLKGFQSGGIDILMDESRLIKIRDEEFYLMGIDYPRKGLRFYQNGVQQHLDKALQGVKQDRPRILMAHHPNSFYDSQKHNIDLTLSGHTHGGQVVFGEVGNTELSFAKLGFPFLKGYYKKNDHHLYVNSGLGHWLPMRFNCPPEITQFILT